MGQVEGRKDARCDKLLTQPSECNRACHGGPSGGKEVVPAEWAPGCRKPLGSQLQVLAPVARFHDGGNATPPPPRLSRPNREMGLQIREAGTATGLQGKGYNKRSALPDASSPGRDARSTCETYPQLGMLVFTGVCYRTHLPVAVYLVGRAGRALAPAAGPLAT
ncbi:hypothetical protein MAPG_05875 [Magnaporthiopsis poae ATCC 64411]|uniref:Uncharacterized protein n=1 Tax=Magnaporthiopsis poae (strain ATCC 64411 / 73-15) TaxID=644358 RepID=A0A0C4E0J8_MAGP6|nr:hypothetical protein MAPG_05875 [Magnaporthiopsis poae ATCC 64411]